MKKSVLRKRSPPLYPVYKILLRAFGPQHWWPARTRLEMVVGAVLTQNTAWTNVEKAIRRLKNEKALTLRVLHEVDPARLAEWIRPAGYFNVKTRRLKSFAHMIYERFDGSLARLWRLDTDRLRTLLLQVHGFGPETVDSILLYAAKRPVFVVDAYTQRFLYRHGWMDKQASYDEVAAGFTTRMPAKISEYNEYHALIVALGKQFCRTKPLCDQCPLRPRLPRSGPRL